MKIITRTVWMLSLVSLFTDMASEMLYPIMPVYLKHIGFSIVLIGVLEGVAEAVAGLSKGYFGKLSDAQAWRVPFVQWGYALSALSKPLMAAFVYPLWIFFARTVDRLGKGIRTGARDALLSDEATPQTKGKVFGLHRAMDTTGAAIGPALALVFLHFYPQQYTILFLLAAVPGLLAVAASLLLKENKKAMATTAKKPALFAFLKYWKESPVAYRRLATGLLLFTLINSSDVFLLLKAKESGLSDTAVIGVYIFYNLVFALAAFPLGISGDRWGLKKVFILGLFLFAIVYAGMAFTKSLYGFIALFFVYGIYAAATEGISKAWISNIVQKKNTATAIGTFTGLQSLCALLASSATGLLWQAFGGSIAFAVTAIGTLLLVVYFIALPAPQHDIS